VTEAAWPIGPFTAHGEILGPLEAPSFSCPVLGSTVQWAAKDVFNPAAVVRDDQLCLLFRGEDTVGRFSGTSRIGLAVSQDGLRFEVEPEPVLFPDNGIWQSWEWAGGCEDPRLVEAPDGGYVCLYTAFDGKSSALFVATSDDLRTWEKHGPAFAGTPYVRRWSKSGAVVTEVRDGHLVASKVNDQFLMYWGEGTCFAATSSDLIHWTPVEFDSGGDRYLSYHGDDVTGSWEIHRVSGQRVLRPLLFPRPGRFDSLLVEPGPPAIKTEHGVVLIYNGADVTVRGPDDYTVSYQPGQVLFDANDLLSPIARCEAPTTMLGEQENLEGQVDNVRFAQGLALFKGSWFLYYGMGDSRIGCATAPLS